jgi:predicted nucleic acid-binding protein
VAALVDTNVLVYRFDPRDSRKQGIAERLLREGIRIDSIRVPHQAILEFVAACTRRMPTGPLLSPEDARREAEELLSMFEVLYPNEAIVRTALRGAAAYQLSWFDAHLWAYAEHYGMTELYSEDFQHDRLYGSVRAINPFLDEAIEEDSGRPR